MSNFLKETSNYLQYAGQIDILAESPLTDPYRVIPALCDIFTNLAHLSSPSQGVTYFHAAHIPNISVSDYYVRYDALLIFFPPIQIDKVLFLFT